MRKFLVILLIGSCCTANAGEVYLCKYFSKKGGPMLTADSWKAGKDKICVAYKHDSYYKDSAVYSLRISRLADPRHPEQPEFRPFRVAAQTNWSIGFIRIKTPGNYVISVIDDCGYILGERACRIR